MQFKPNSIFEAANSVLKNGILEGKLSDAARQKIAIDIYTNHKEDAHAIGNMLIKLAVNKGKLKNKQSNDWSGYREPGRDQSPTNNW